MAGNQNQNECRTIACRSDFGTIVFGSLTALSALAVLWLSHGAGTNDPHATVFGLAVSPILYLIFVGPFALLFVVSLLRGLKN